MAKQSSEMIDIDYINSLKSINGMPYEKQRQIASNLLKWLHHQNAKINIISFNDGSTILKASVLLTAIQMSPEHQNSIGEVFDDHLKAFFNEVNENGSGSPLKYFSNRLLLSSNGYQHIEEALAYWKLFYPNEKLQFNTEIDNHHTTDPTTVTSFIQDECPEIYRKISGEISKQKLTVELTDSDSNDHDSVLTKATASQNQVEIGFRRPAATPLSVVVISDDDKELSSQKSQDTDNETNDGYDCRSAAKISLISQEFHAADSTAASKGPRLSSIDCRPPNLESTPSITSPQANEFDSEDSLELETIEKARILLNEIFALQADDISEAINRCLNIECASISFPIFLAILNQRFPLTDCRESFIFLAEMKLRLLGGDKNTNSNNNITEVFLNELFKPPNFNALLKMLHDPDFRYSFFTFLLIALRTLTYGDSVLYVINEILTGGDQEESEIRQALRKEIRKSQSRLPLFIVERISEWHFLQSTKETIEPRQPSVC